MKGLQHEKQLSIFVAILLCTAVLVCSWKRSLFLGNHGLFQEVPQDIVLLAATVGEAKSEGAGEISKRIEGSENSGETGKEEIEAGHEGMEIIQGKEAEIEKTKEDIKVLNRTSEQGYSNRSEVKVCNYGKGKWVVDKNYTLYSGFKCRKWLRSNWACRLSRRPDFSYENLRWQPKDCPLEPFESSKFLKRLQNKTLAFAGDSLAKQQFQSLMCMITGGELRDDIVSVSREFGGSQALRFLATNTTLVMIWSTTLCEVRAVNKSDPETNNAVHLDRPEPLLVRHVHKMDVLVLNTMHHWSPWKFMNNRWVTYLGGVPNSSPVREAWNATVHNIVNWANEQMTKHPGLRVLYRTTSPRHFTDGDWNTGGRCDKVAMNWAGKESGDERDLVAESAVEGTRVRLLDITGLTTMRDEAHISRYRGSHILNVSDCSHWCLPGVPDTWNNILYALLQ